MDNNKVSKIAGDLFKIIANRYHNISMMDKDGKSTTLGSDARLFNLMFLPKRQDTLVTISLLDLPDLKIAYDRSMIDSFDKHTRADWFRFVSKDLRRFSIASGINHKLLDLDKSQLSSRDVATMIRNAKAKEKSNEELAESRFSKLAGTKMSSVQMLERHRIKVKHSTVINDDVRGSRSRRIKALYIENNLNERRRFPYLSLEGVRAMARHLEEGGDWNDRIGQHILETTGNLVTIRKFVREVRRQRCDERILPILEQLREKQQNYRRRLMLVSGAKGYHSYTKNMDDCYVEPVPSLEGYFASVDPGVSSYLPKIERILGERSATTLEDQTLREYVEWINGRVLLEAPAPAPAPAANNMPTLYKPLNVKGGNVKKLDNRMISNLKIRDPADMLASQDKSLISQVQAKAKNNTLTYPVLSTNDNNEVQFVSDQPIEQVKLLWLMANYPGEIKKINVFVLDKSREGTKTNTFKTGFRAFDKFKDFVDDPVSGIRRRLDSI